MEVVIQLTQGNAEIWFQSIGSRSDASDLLRHWLQRMPLFELWQKAVQRLYSGMLLLSGADHALHCLVSIF